MAYSRWINSDYYTYWISGSKGTKDEQMFMVHSSLVNQVEVSVEDAKKYIEDPSLLFEIEEFEVHSTTDAIELTGYMEEWLQDLDEKYGEE